MRFSLYNIKWLFAISFLFWGSLSFVPAVSAQENTEETPKKTPAERTPEQRACDQFDRYMLLPLVRIWYKNLSAEINGTSSEKDLEAGYASFCKCLKKVTSMLSKAKNEKSAESICKEIQIYLATSDYAAWPNVDDYAQTKKSKQKELEKLTEQYQSEYSRICEMLSDKTDLERVNDMLNGESCKVPSKLIAKISKKYVGDYDKALKTAESALTILKTVKDKQTADEAAERLKSDASTMTKLRAKVFKNRAEYRCLMSNQDVREIVPNFKKRVLCMTELHDLLTPLSNNEHYYDSEALQKAVFKLLGCETQREAGDIWFDPKMFTRKAPSRKPSEDEEDSDDEE